MTEYEHLANPCYIIHSIISFHPSYLPAAVPDPPHTLVASNITKTEATITWQPPVNDGGTPLTGYHVERCSDNSARWVRQTRQPITETTYYTDNLMQGTEYQYRAVALNKRGESVPSEPTESFIAELPYGMDIIINYLENFVCTIKV